MGKIIQFPFEKKQQKDEFYSAIDDLKFSKELKEQLKLDLWPYIDKYSKISNTDLKMEIPNNISQEDEALIVSQVKLLFNQLQDEKNEMLKEITKLASDNIKLKFNANNAKKED